ncbi:hypothetical protein FRC04_005346 [Tulasnella sp. 424]|nr:hypothetical protein FRC04_005346 [Tulasnella sp. 424]KAG8976456.1 hypothetical protein FRC05_003699 [Tulasnella sp. 425]
MQQPEKHHPRVTFALPPPSPSPPPQELQHQKQPTPQSSSQQQRAERKTEERKRQAGPPPTLTAAQLIAHAAGPPTTGGSIKHAPQSPRGSSVATTASSASSSSWTVSYPRLRRVPDKKALPAVDSNASWPGVIGYQRLPSCYESPGEIGPSSAGAVTLLGTTHLGPPSPSSSAGTLGVSNSTLRILDSPGATRSATLTPRSRNSNLRSVSSSGGTNPHRGATRNKPWTWNWTPGAATSPIYDPDYANGSPECLAPRPKVPSSTAASPNANSSRTGRSAATKRLRGGEATSPNEVDQDDTRSNASGSSSAGSYASSADSSQLFVTEVGGVGIMGTVESIWGEQLSEFRTLRV